MKYNKKLILSATASVALMGGQLQAGNITQALTGATDAFVVEQPAGTELMRVHGDGNVGISVATPTHTLDVNGTTRVRNLSGGLSSDTIMSVDASGVLRDSGITLQALNDAIANAQTAVDAIDTDGDGIPNNTDTDDDNDGLSDVDEATAGTNPLIADTDGDGVSDGQEIIDGTDPLDDQDFTALAPDPLPGNVVLDGGKVLYLASILDSDYTPYTAVSVPATLATNVAADGTAEPTTVDVQGSLDNTGKTVGIPYTVTTASVNLPAFTQTISVPANVTQDGTGRDITLSYPAQSLAVGTGVVLANIKTTAGTLNAKKLDIQTGIGDGTDTIISNSNGGVTKSVLGYLMGTFTIALNAAGDTAEVQLRDVAGIPDRMMGQADNNGATGTHNFLYLPVTNPTTGKTWLNNNLGADYANVNHASFNINQQAQTATTGNAATDYHAYGSLFQWGRQADGHELITWTSGTKGAGVSGVTRINNNNPTNTLFIREGSSPYDWRSSQDVTLWASESSTNNVCPLGYRLPLNPNGAKDADNEFYQETRTWTSQNAAGAATSTLALSLSGNRYHGNGTVSIAGTYGDYWSGSVNSRSSRSMYLHTSAVYPNNGYYRAYGFSVRCLKN
jgi:uncharacterized protein (TIGR02145 family)